MCTIIYVRGEGFETPKLLTFGSVTWIYLNKIVKKWYMISHLESVQ